MLDQFFWELEKRSDYRHTPEVKKILNEDPLFEEKDATPEEIEENKKWWETFNASTVVEFLRRSEVVADKVNELEIEENKYPYRKEDRDLWKKMLLLPGPDGRPIP